MEFMGVFDNAQRHILGFCVEMLWTLCVCVCRTKVSKHFPNKLSLFFNFATFFDF